MLIRMLVSRAGVDSVQSVGDTIDVDSAEAIRMIDAGQAVPMRVAAKEKAVK